MAQLVIIGAGPAGISAALYAKRGGVDTLVVENGASALIRAHKIENYYGCTASGEQMYAQGIAQAQKLGIEVVNDEVLSLEYDGEFKIVCTGSEYTSQALLIATGAARKTPNIDGLNRLTGKGISFCAVCDAFFFRGKSVVVIGEGEYAVHEAEVLKNTSSHVEIIAPDRILRVNGEQKVDGVVLKDGTVVDCEGVFVAIGVAGADEFARKIGAMSIDGKIKTDENMRTNIPGLYAAGDCTGGLLQVAKAVRDGAVAGLEIIKYIKKPS